MIGSSNNSGGVVVGALVCGTECSGFESRFRPYKILYLILIHLFPKNRGGRRHFIFFYSSGH